MESVSYKSKVTSFSVCSQNYPGCEACIQVSHVGTTWQRYAGYGFLPAESQKGAVRHVYGRTAKADCGYG